MLTRGIGPAVLDGVESKCRSVRRVARKWTVAEIQEREESAHGDCPEWSALRFRNGLIAKHGRIDGPQPIKNHIGQIPL